MFLGTNLEEYSRNFVLGKFLCSRVCEFLYSFISIISTREGVIIIIIIIIIIYSQKRRKVR